MLDRAHDLVAHAAAPRWRVAVAPWPEIWRRARAALCFEADPACKDASRAYWLASGRPGVEPEKYFGAGPLLDTQTLPALRPERRTTVRVARSKRKRLAGQADQHRAEAYMAQVVDNLASIAPGSRNAALNRAAWTLGRWVACGALEQGEVEDALYAAAERNGLVADDGQRQCWATIRSGLSAGLQEGIELDTDANL